jgi:hypothetical protein
MIKNTRFIAGKAEYFKVHKQRHEGGIVSKRSLGDCRDDIIRHRSKDDENRAVVSNI